MQCILISPHCSLYGCYFFILIVRKECREVSLHPQMFILFRAAEKERTKISREPKSLISCESLRHRKRRPPETPIPLRMPVMAKWAKLASLKQTPIFNAMPFILIVRQSRPTSHSRNGAACKQMQTITDSYLENLSSFLQNIR